MNPNISLDICEKFNALITSIDSQIHIATIDDSEQNKDFIREYLSHTNKDLVFHKKEKEEFSSLVSKTKMDNILKKISNSQNDEAGILELLDFIFEHSIAIKGSDIHIERQKDITSIRVRVDGKIREVFTIENEISALLTSRIKLDCSLDIHENRKPQDGRIGKYFNSEEYDFRVSTLPTISGESMVIRILKQTKITLEDLGFSNQNLSTITPALFSPNGIIFITGPTGSGKTTTLYSILEKIKSVDKKIITIEDPVEYTMELATQIAINEKYGFGFSHALRSILRQDPDIIMVGEIRDEPTLSLAIQASLTGHLVLSTLHTNDCISTIDRLLDMGAQSYLIASSLELIISQRLIRKLCNDCKEKTTISDQILKMIPKDFRQSQFYKPNGCPKCNFKGYIGREVISETLRCDKEVKELIYHQNSKSKILEYANSIGFKNIFFDAFKKASEGITSIEEVLTK